MRVSGKTISVVSCNYLQLDSKRRKTGSAKGNLSLSQIASGVDDAIAFHYSNYMSPKRSTLSAGQVIQMRQSYAVFIAAALAPRLTYHDQLVPLSLKVT